MHVPLPQWNSSSSQVLDVGEDSEVEGDAEEEIAGLVGYLDVVLVVDPQWCSSELSRQSSWPLHSKYLIY